MFFFVFYTLIISYLFLGSGDLAVFHKGLLFLSEDDIIWRFFLAYIISTTVMLTTSFLCLMLSTMSKNSVTPIIITISVVFIGSIISFIPLQMFENINPYLFTGYLDLFLSSFHDPVPWNTIFISFGVCTFWSLFFLIIAFIIFNRKEILS